MEPVPKTTLKRPRITPEAASGAFYLELPLTQNKPGQRVRATLKTGGGEACTAGTAAHLDLAPHLTLTVPEDRRRFWSPSDPYLYDIDIALVGAIGTIVDSAASYAGLRSIAIDGLKVKINGETIFQLTVLDQGYYPSIIGWCPLNETSQKITDSITVLDDVTHGMYLATKAMALSRPVLDTSGYSHRVIGQDIYGSHDYIDEKVWSVGFANFKARHAMMAAGKVFINDGKKIFVPYEG